MLTNSLETNMKRRGNRTCDNSEPSMISAITTLGVGLAEVILYLLGALIPCAQTKNLEIGSAKFGRRPESLKAIVMGGILGVPGGGQVGGLSENLLT